MKPMSLKLCSQRRVLQCVIHSDIVEELLRSGRNNSFSPKPQAVYHLISILQRRIEFSNQKPIKEKNNNFLFYY